MLCLTRPSTFTTLHSGTHNRAVGFVHVSYISVNWKNFTVKIILRSRPAVKIRKKAYAMMINE